MVGIPASLARSVRAALTPLLTHTYSRYTPDVPVEPPETDDYGDPVVEDGPTTGGLACMYLASRRLVQRDEGAIVLDVPTLYVRHDDGLAVGDRVVGVTDRDGTVLIAEAVVESFDPAAEAGASAMKIAILRIVQAVN